MITFALVIFLLFLLRQYRHTADRRWLYPIPPMFVVWVNLHAGFTIGLVFLAITVFGETLYRAFRKVGAGNREGAPMRPLLVASLIAALAVMINPNTWQIYLYAAQTQFSTAQQMLLLIPVLLMVSARKPRVTDLLLLLATIVLALQSVRHIALFVAVTVPVLAEAGQGAWEALTGGREVFRDPRPNPVLGTLNALILLAVMTFVLVVAIPHVRSGPTSDAVRKDYPVAAVDALQADLPPGQMFNQYGWGGYLTYRLWPQRKVFIYGDAAVMGDPFLDEFQSVELIRPNFRDTLRARKVTWVIDSPGVPLVVALSQTDEWVQVYSDRVATVMVRRTPDTAGWLARHGHP
jgi:hypothetical protein